MTTKQTTISSRLKEKRNKAGLTQEDFSRIGGCCKGSQKNYESDISPNMPDANYLVAVSSIIDINYVLTGENKEPEVDKKIMLGEFVLLLNSKSTSQAYIKALNKHDSFADVALAVANAMKQTKPHSSAE